MIAELAARHAPLLLAMAELILLAGLFGGLWIWVYRKGNRGAYEAAARIPLESED